MLDFLMSPIDYRCESPEAVVLNVEMQLTQRQVTGIVLWAVSNCGFIKLQFSLCPGQMLIFITTWTEHRINFFIFGKFSGSQWP